MFFPYNAFLPEEYYQFILPFRSVVFFIADTFIPIVIITVSNILVMVKLKKNLNSLRKNSTRMLYQLNSDTIQVSEARSQSRSSSSNSTKRAVREAIASRLSHRTVNRREKELKKTVFTLIAISVEFCVFKVPFAVYIITRLLNDRSDLVLNFFSKLENLHHFQKISSFLNILNQSGNFVLYFIHMGSFRKEFLGLFIRCYRLIRR
jgi:hypothetical protein